MNEFFRIVSHSQPDLGSTYLRIPDVVTNKYQNTHGSHLKKLTEILTDEADILSALRGMEGETTSVETATTPSPAPVRTVATPDFAGEQVPTFGSNVELQPSTMDDFSASVQFHGCIYFWNCLGFIFVLVVWTQALRYLSKNHPHAFEDCFRGRDLKLKAGNLPKSVWRDLGVKQHFGKPSSQNVRAVRLWCWELWRSHTRRHKIFD